MSIIDTTDIFIKDYFSSSKSITEKLDKIRSIITDSLFNELKPPTIDYNDTIGDNIDFKSVVSDLTTYYNKKSDTDITTISTFSLNNTLNGKTSTTEKVVKLDLKYIDNKYLINKILINSNLS